MSIHSCTLRFRPLPAMLACALAPSLALAQNANAPLVLLPSSFSWTTIANSASPIPDGDGRTFNSFNQPSVSSRGTVVLRGRSRGGQGAGEPLRGVYSRSMSSKTATLVRVFDTATEVPQPNNVLYSGALGTFTEFPAFPRIGLDSDTVVSRAQSKPVYEYQIGVDPVTGEPVTTRAGTSGVYVAYQGARTSAMTQLGGVAGFEHYGVPGATQGTKFDQFPGSPAMANATTVAFKGNYTDGVGKTDVFFRSFSGGNGPASTQVIASSDTLIPGQDGGTTRFGSTAPPSASSTSVVFLGLDNEEAPTMGGIYRAPLAPSPALQVLVSIGGQVPGESPGVGFSRLGEALSYDGRFVAFWGSWGSAFRTVTLTCPEDGQAAVIAFCREAYPNGYTVHIPVQQGFFVHDVAANKTTAVVKTGDAYIDFLYWNFSGRPPGVGESEAEEPEAPRWRSATFVAAHSSKGIAQVAFKARRPTVPEVDGVYLTLAPGLPPVYRTVVETTAPATQLDPAAPAGAKVTTVGIERDGLRGGWLAISASMLDPLTSESWAGVYLTRSRRP